MSISVNEKKIEKNKIDNFLNQLKLGTNWTSSGKITLAEQYRKINDKDELSLIIKKEPKGPKKINLKKKLKAVIEIAQTPQPLETLPRQTIESSRPLDALSLSKSKPSWYRPISASMTAPSSISQSRTTLAAPSSSVASATPTLAAPSSIAQSKALFGAPTPIISEERKKIVNYFRRSLKANEYTDSKKNELQIIYKNFKENERKFLDEIVDNDNDYYEKKNLNEIKVLKDSNTQKTKIIAEKIKEKIENGMDLDNVEFLLQNEIRMIPRDNLSKMINTAIKNQHKEVHITDEAKKILENAAQLAAQEVFQGNLKSEEEIEEGEYEEFEEGEL